MVNITSLRGKGSSRSPNLKESPKGLLWLTVQQLCDLGGSMLGYLSPDSFESSF